MINVERQIAKYLLQSNAIKLSPARPFSWASGWKSPIYCDNRITLSFPDIRSYIRDQFVQLIVDKFGEPACIAGVATGAIAQGALVADMMNIPFVYVRSSAKEHGLENLIEGSLEKGSTVVVIEDLISTGGSSIKAVEALRNAGAEVLGMCAIFTYAFDLSEINFNKINCEVYTLSDYNVLIDEALALDFIKENDVNILKAWRENPEHWGK